TVPVAEQACPAGPADPQAAADADDTLMIGDPTTVATANARASTPRTRLRVRNDARFDLGQRCHSPDPARWLIADPLANGVPWERAKRSSRYARCCSRVKGDTAPLPPVQWGRNGPLVGIPPLHTDARDVAAIIPVSRRNPH